MNARSDPTALILTGTGDVFAPGGELRGVREDPNSVVDGLAHQDVTPFEAVYHSAAPVVAAVNSILPGRRTIDRDALRCRGGQ